MAERKNSIISALLPDVKAYEAAGYRMVAYPFSARSWEQCGGGVYNEGEQAFYKDGKKTGYYYEGGAIWAKVL